jgi:hypothetical protein
MKCCRAGCDQDPASAPEQSSEVREGPNVVVSTFVCRAGHKNVITESAAGYVIQTMAWPVITCGLGQTNPRPRDGCGAA